MDWPWHGVEAAALVELVDGDQVGVVEHVDLLELGRCSELRRHDVERDVGELGDLGVRLADAGALQQDQVEAGAAQHVANALGGEQHDHVASEASRQQLVK